MRDVRNEVENEAKRVFERTFSAASGLPTRAARSVVAFALEAGFGPACRARIGSALAEVVDNAVRRGYPTTPGTIDVQAEVQARELVVTVTDHGIGFDTELLDDDLLSRPLYSGLARASALSDGLALDSEIGTGTTVVLRFAAASSAFDSDGTVDLTDHDFLAPDTARRVLHTLRRHETSSTHQLSPALAVVVGRLLAGPEPRALVDRALWS
ncbi:MAG: ATP-binding protein [Planctomycetota bacterium]|nr:ATP-binding protein [Planctomycetota bacterium]